MSKRDFKDVIEWGCIIVVFTAMMAYGIGKLVQFNYEIYLDKTVRELTPMQLMWAFYGYSLVHAIVLGIVEITGGVLLLFRRTRVIACMVLIPVLSYVIFQDIIYDVLKGALFAAINYLILTVIILFYNRQKFIEIVSSLFDKSIRPKSKLNIFLKIILILLSAIIIKFLEIQITHFNW